MNKKKSNIIFNIIWAVVVCVDIIALWKGVIDKTLFTSVLALLGIATFAHDKQKNDH